MDIKMVTKRNWIFILFVIVACFSFIKKDNYLPMDVVPYPDTYVEFAANQSVLEQTWLSEVKEISEVSVSCMAKNTIQNEMQIRISDALTGEFVAQASQIVDMIADEEKKITFTFPKTKIIQGNQYNIHLKFLDAEQTDKIWIKAGTNYMGCSIDGVDQELGAAFEITYIKNSKIFWIFSSLFPLVAFSFLYMVVWHRKWEEVIGLAMATLVFTLFLFGLFGYLEWGIIAVYILAAISFLVAVLLFNKQNMEIKDIISVGVVVFGVVFILIMLNNIDSRFARWDEFSHWGLAAKDMFYSNSFAKHFDSTVMIKYYPPVATLVEYFFCYTNRLFSPNMVYVGFQTLGLCLLSVGFGICKNRKMTVGITLGAIMLFVPITFFYDVYNSIYVDPLLAFGVAYILICYYTTSMDLFNFIRILGGLFLLTMTKDTGVVLAGVLTLVMLGDTLYKQWKEKKWNIVKMGLPILGTIFVCSIFFTWQIYLSIPVEKVSIDTDTIQAAEAVEPETMAVTGAVGASGINLDGIIDLFTGNAPAYRYQVIENYLTKIFSENTFSFGIISLSYMDLTFVMLAVSLLISMYWKRDRFLSFGLLTSIASLGYGGFLLVAYLFSFSEIEALMILSFSRYMGSCVCGIFIALLVLVIDAAKDKERIQEGTVLIAILTMVLVALPIQNFYVKNEDTQLTDEQVYGFDDLADILQTGGKKADRVYFVCNNSDGHAELQFKSAVVPMITDYPICNIFGSKDDYMRQLAIYGEKEQDAKGTPYYITAEEWADKLENYEYVVVFHPNDVFSETYGTLFEQPETIDDGTVYKVINVEDEIKLNYIGKTGIKSFR